MRLSNSAVDDSICFSASTASFELSRPGRKRKFSDSIGLGGLSRSSSALWASGADSHLDGLTVRGAPVGFRPSLLAGEQRLRIG
jgi:hypothetical protein